MPRITLVKDIRKLGEADVRGTTTNSNQQRQYDIIKQITSLGYSHELWDALMAHKGMFVGVPSLTIALQTLLELDVSHAAILWKHQCVEGFVNKAWAGGFLPDWRHAREEPTRGGFLRASWRYYKYCVAQPR